MKAKNHDKQQIKTGVSIVLYLLFVLLLSCKVYAIELSEIVPYSGAPYTVLNENVPMFSEGELIEETFEYYTALDSLGRCGTAYANICMELMPTEERDAIGNIKPSGWHTVKYDVIEDMYLYNRCHLIGYQLSGENANELNLITGTRYLNIEGMLPFENQVASYVESTQNHVLYRVTPIYAGDNLIAGGVQIEAKSVEDNGAGIEFNVFCYNVQPEIWIDYSTGDSSLLSEHETAIESIDTQTSGQDYVLNTNTKKFHYLYCNSVDQMKEKNKAEYTGTRDELISMGYDPCGNCTP